MHSPFDREQPNLSELPVPDNRHDRGPNWGGDPSCRAPCAGPQQSRHSLCRRIERHCYSRTYRHRLPRGQGWSLTYPGACMFAQWGAASLSEVHTDAADSLMGVAKANKRRIVALEAQLKVRERDQPPHQAPTLEHAPWTSAHGPVGCPRGSAPAAVRGRRNPPPPWLREGSSPGEGGWGGQLE